MPRLLHVTQTIEACGLTDTKSLPDQGYLWLIAGREENFDLAKWTLDIVGKPIHPRHLNDLSQKNHPSYYDCISQYDILILRTASRLEAGPRKALESATYLLFDKLLISIYEGSEQDFDKLFAYATDRNRSLPTSPALMMESCLDYTVNHLIEFKAPLESRMNSWQKRLLKVSRGKTMDWTGLLDFKADLRKLRAICEEQNDALVAWRTSMNGEINKPYAHTENLTISLNDSVEHSSRMINFIIQLQSELESLLQLHFTILGHRTNEIMRIIAIITGIFMPANLIAGIYGMNFSSLPEVGSPHGLAHILALMVVTTAASLGIFYWLKWL